MPSFRLPRWFAEHVEPVPDSEDLRVSTLELFVDLVFVFTMTQFTALLAEDLARGVPQTLLMFGVIWWMFAGYAWATNSVPPTRPARRLLLLFGMAGWLIVALAVPTAFVTGQVAFALAAGVERAIGHATEPLHLGSAALIAGGLALFLAGSAGFRRSLSLGGSSTRLLLALLALVTIPLGLLVAAWVQLAVLVILMIAALTLEHHRRV